MIEVINLHKSFGNEDVLKGVNLTVKKGETLTLIGGSGKGKSVLLKHIVGLLKPDKGQVLIDGEDISILRGKRLKKIKELFGVVFQAGALFDSLNVFENVAFPLQEKTRLTSSEIRSKVLKELAEVGMLEDVDKYPSQISGGMKKRVALARCLVMEPEIILFDEPTTGLDPVTTKSIHKLILTLKKKRNLTAIIVSHEIPDIFTITDRVAMLDEGRIIFEGTPEEIKTTTNPTVRRFVDGKILKEEFK